MSKQKNSEYRSDIKTFGGIALLCPPRARVRATVKLSATFFLDESSITIGGGYGSAIAPTLFG